MVLSLKYKDLSDMVTEANKLANEFGQYCNELSSKVQQKMYSVHDGMTSALHSADYYVNDKIKQLRARELNVRTLSTTTQVLLETARRVDEDVKATIEANQVAFFNRNPDLKPSDIKLGFISFLTWGRDVPVLGWLLKTAGKTVSATNALNNSIKDWYKNGGGKELLINWGKAIIKIGEAVLAVVVFVTVIASGAALIFIVAAAILAVIKTVNAIVKTGTMLEATVHHVTGDNEKAKSLYKIDSLNDYLRSTGSPFLSGVATALGWLEFGCEVVMVVYNIGKAGKELGQLISKIKTGGFGATMKGFLQGLRSITLKDVAFGSFNAGDLKNIDNKKKFIKTGVDLSKGLMDVWEGKYTWSDFGWSMVSDRVFNAFEVADSTDSFEKTKNAAEKTGIPKYWADRADSTGRISYILGFDDGLVQKFEKTLNRQNNILDEPTFCLPEINLSPPFAERYPYFCVADAA